jgi:Matrixin
MMLRRFAFLVSLALILALPASAHAGGRVASGTGVKHVNGKTVYVDVVVAVPEGQTAGQATDQALAEQGARRAKPPWAGGPGGPAGGGGDNDEQYFYTGLEWSPPSVTQNYNAAGEPLPAEGALTNTHADWNGVAGSDLHITYGGRTPRCPSLVRECSGPQANDGNNDVAWLALGGGSTLGVTWFTPSDPEADMALNTRFAWKNTCGSSGGNSVDVETVLLHENGHVAGLDHTNRTDSVMYPNYQSPRCTLFPYDERSIANLY